MHRKHIHSSIQSFLYPTYTRIHTHTLACMHAYTRCACMYVYTHCACTHTYTHCAWTHVYTHCACTHVYTHCGWTHVYTHCACTHVYTHCGWTHVYTHCACTHVYTHCGCICSLSRRDSLSYHDLPGVCAEKAIYHSKSEGHLDSQPAESKENSLSEDDKRCETMR